MTGGASLQELLGAIVREELRLRFDASPLERANAAYAPWGREQRACEGCQRAASVDAFGHRALGLDALCKPHREGLRALDAAYKRAEAEEKRLAFAALARDRGRPSRLLRRRPR